MQNIFNIKPLPKTHSSYSRNPNHSKYYISCQSKITNETPTSEPWLRILKLLKIDISDSDKSRILLGNLDKYGEIVVKVGNPHELKHEYDFSRILYSTKGFVKYICFFECNDDFRMLPDSTRNTICRGPGNQMGIILMPHFQMGSLAKYVWNAENIHVMQSCIKHAFLSILNVFFSYGIIHGDFHPGNVLLKTTKQSNMTYFIEGIGEINNIPLHGIRPWIMDFENTEVADMDSNYERVRSYNTFYFDVIKFFMLLGTFISKLDVRTIIPIQTVLNKSLMRSEMLSKEQIYQILNLIDNIQVM